MPLNILQDSTLVPMKSETAQAINSAAVEKSQVTWEGLVKNEGTCESQNKNIFPSFYFFFTFTRPSTFCRGIWTQNTETEPTGKLVEKSIIITLEATCICISLYFPFTKSTGATLREEVGKISLRIFPILCVSRINGLKQIRNRLNEVPLVK